jgi:D-glycero-D-manno-heptose 1,7-bisphosphate phosphatase
MINIGGRPFIEYLIWNLSRQGIKDIFILAGYNSDVIIDHFNQKELYGTKITILVESTPLGTAGSLILHKELFNKSFWLLNGDTFFDCSYIDLYNKHKNDEEIIIFGKQFEKANRFGSITFDSDFYIKNFEEKKHNKNVAVNAGVYLFHKEYLREWDVEFLSLENDVFPYLAAKKKIKIYLADGYFIDIGVPESLLQAKKDFPYIQEKPALFLDRDGTINIDSGYSHKTSELKLIDGVAEAIKYASNKGYYVVIITNQGGISKGIFTIQDMNDFNNELLQILRSQGANVDYIYFCIHHPEALLRSNRLCNCRKPKPGMLLNAFSELPIKLQGSVMIGDKLIDKETAERAEIKGFHFNQNNLYNFIIQEQIL